MKSSMTENTNTLTACMIPAEVFHWPTTHHAGLPVSAEPRDPPVFPS